MLQNFLILLGCILLFLVPTWYFYYKKKKVKPKPKLKSKPKTNSYLYVIKHSSYDWDVYKLGKTNTTPRRRMYVYETAHKIPPRYVLLFKVSLTKNQLNQLETTLKYYLRTCGRLAVPDKVRKEMYRFESPDILYDEITKVLLNNRVKFVDLLATKQYDETGRKLKAL